MARDIVETDTIGADDSTPGILRLFLKNLPAQLPSTSNVADGYVLTINNGEGAWLPTTVGEDTQARDNITALQADVGAVEASLGTINGDITALENGMTAVNGRVDGVQAAVAAVRQVPAGGSSGQVLIRDSADPAGYRWTDADLGGGEQGEPGSKIYIQPGAPLAGFGLNADMYIDESSALLNYYYKESGSWVLQGTLRGAEGQPGAAGTTFRYGNTVPASGLGVNGDTYYHTTTYDMYQKIAGTWTVIGNLRGAPGTTGAKGNTFASWSFNGNGDSYFHTPMAITLQTPQIRNGATVVFAYSVDGTTFSTATFPLSMVSNSVLRARASNVNTWATAASAGS
jgi:hypothetical protein